MAEEKFNPIAGLPHLPGAEIQSDEVATNIADSTYPVENKLGKVRPGEIKPEEVIVSNEDEGNGLKVTRTIILACLIGLVLLGIFLTLFFVPKIASDISSIFSSNKTANPVTTNAPIQVPAKVIVATSTMQATAATSTVLTSATKAKTPAKLVSSIFSTNFVGNQEIVRFNIQNVGGTTSGTWSFNAILPSSATPVYYSQTQSPLTPFSGVIYTLTFTADQDTLAQINIFQ